MDPVNGWIPELVGVNDAILPIPVEASPMLVLLLLQEYDVPVPLNEITDDKDPLQSVTLGTVATIGVGFTVIVACWLMPLQVNPPFVKSGVTVIVPIKGEELLEFKAVKDKIFPVPLDDNPMLGVLFNQEYDVLFPLNKIVFVEEPLHTIWFVNGFKVGVGFTVIVNVCIIPGQFKLLPVKIGWTVIVAVTGEFVVFWALKLVILPIPVAAKPIEGVLLDHE